MIISTGQELTEFITGLNGNATVDPTLLNVLVETAKTVIEGERPWMVLQKTDKTKTVSSSNTWLTAIDLSTITDFSRFFVMDDAPVLQLFDGQNRVQEYYLKPLDQRLDWKDDSNTCVFDENTMTLYLNGSVPFSGTLWIRYVSFTDDVDLTSASAIWTRFPKRFLPVLGFYAIGVYKGGVDYDSINRQMLPTNQSVLDSLRQMMTDWDDEKALASIQANDPSEHAGGGWGDRRIDRYN